MRRGANLVISQWFLDSNRPEQWSRAACIDHQHLPWTHDTMPSRNELAAMRDVCEGCPLLTRCADYALNRRVGGFYAGAWLPWSGPVESDFTRLARIRARRYYRHVLGSR